MHSAGGPWFSLPYRRIALATVSEVTVWAKGECKGVLGGGRGGWVQGRAGMEKWVD
jgi:hypothetical protein